MFIAIAVSVTALVAFAALVIAGAAYNLAESAHIEHAITLDAAHGVITDHEERLDDIEMAHMTEQAARLTP